MAEDSEDKKNDQGDDSDGEGRDDSEDSKGKDDKDDDGKGHERINDMYPQITDYSEDENGDLYYKEDYDYRMCHRDQSRGQGQWS